MMRKMSIHNIVYSVIAAAVATILFSSPRIHAQNVVNKYSQTNLVSSGYIAAKVTDPNLINPWGMVASATSPLWVSNQGTNTSTVYAISSVEMGTGSALTVKIPTETSPPNGPTGIVFNSASNAFEIPSSMGMVPSSFIFDNLNGTISGWNPGSTGGAASAVVAIDNHDSGASYTGLALGTVGSQTYLYATNFTPQGGVEVYDTSFHPATGMYWASFDADDYLPRLSRDKIWRPYNIVNIAGYMLVAYAAMPATGGLPITHMGLGVVAAFTPQGKFFQIVAEGRRLDAPWGITLAPGQFGKFSNDLLIGNFGNGRILAYSVALPPGDGDYDRDDRATVRFAGLLRDSNHKVIENGFLWTLAVGNGARGADPNTLYITTGGPDEATDGLLAAITAAQ